MIGIRSILTICAFTTVLNACDSTHLYLVKQPGVTIPSGFEWKCLASAKSEIASGLNPVSEEERARFEGNEVRYFLWWGSLSGPRPVQDMDGYISEAQTIFPIRNEYKINLAERYVLCLLSNGYAWPTVESVRKRFNEKNNY